MNTLHDTSLLSFHNKIKSIIADLENLLRRTGKIETALSNAITQESIQVGDTVYSVNKPYHDGKVTRFSKGQEFVFIRTNSGREESKNPGNVRKGTRPAN